MSSEYTLSLGLEEANTMHEVPALCQTFDGWRLTHSPNSLAEAGSAFSISFQERNSRPRDVS